MTRRVPPETVAALLSASPARGTATLIEWGLGGDEGLDAVLDHAEALGHVHPADAERLCDIVMTADAATGRATPRAAYLKARILAERGQLTRALDLIVEARTRWWKAGEPLSALRTDLGRMQVLDDLGRHTDALDLGQALLDHLEQLPPAAGDERMRATLRAAALGNMGVALGFTGRHDRSLECYRASETGYATLEMWTAVAQQRANRGIELLALGRAREAVTALASARETFASAGDRLWAAKCGVHLAEAQHQLGALFEALHVLESARSDLADLGAKAEEVRAQLQISRCYLASGLHAEAGVAAQDAATSAAESNFRHDEAFARLSLSLSQMGLGDLSGAEHELGTARRLFAETEDRQYLARTLLTSAELASAQGRAEEARERLELASQELAAGGWRAPLTWAEILRCDLADPSERFDLLGEIEGAVEALGHPDLRQAYAVRMASLRRARGELDQAEQLLRSAVDAVEASGGRLPDPLLRVAYRSDRLAAHDALVDLLVERGGAASDLEALRISDRSKTQTLLDLAPGSTGGTDGRLTTFIQDDAEGNREFLTLRDDLRATYGVLVDTADGSRRRLLRARAEHLENEISTIRMRWAANAPTRPTAAPGGTDLAPRRPPALSYHVVGDDVLAFVVAGRRVETVRLSGALPRVRRCLEALAAQWNRFQMDAAFVHRHMAALTAATVDVLGDLYDCLVDPVRPLLDELETGTLVVVPHRELHGVPFHALFDGVQHLLGTWSLTVVPVVPTRRPRRPAPTSGGLLTLAFADARTPWILDEARTLTSRVPGSRLLSGPEATTTALASMVPGPSCLHLACHGLYRPGNPLFSALRLADDWLNCADVLDLRLDGALVVLSACESGRSSSGAAEPLGLAWAFLAAGASGVVVSQWVVDDRVTADVMEAFHAALTDGTETAEALRRAQLDVARTHEHPYYWAPFVYVGQPATDADLKEPG